MASGVALGSAAGLLALLSEEDERLKVHALQRLYKVVDHHWAEVAQEVSVFEALYETPGFPEQQLAAALASKCFYHLEVYDDALKFALGAGAYFDVNARGEYIDTMIAKCIDEYRRQRVLLANAKPGDAPAPIDPKLEVVVNRMFERCFADGEFAQAIGVALESHRLDVVEEAVQRSGPRIPDMLAFCFDAAQNLVSSRHFRAEVLNTLVKLYNSTGQIDYLNLCRCHQFLDDATAVAQVIVRLLSHSQDEHVLTAFQIGFDLCENDNQKFLGRVLALLPAPPTAEGVAAVASEESLPVPEGADTPAFWAAIADVKRILDGSKALEVHLDFLFRHNNTDPLLLLTLKAASEGNASADSRSSVLHNAAVAAHAFMSCGTAVDAFLRDNMSWLGKATAWARFSAVASQGVVHKGNLSSSRAVLAPYLPSPGRDQPYPEGGSLFALGLIHAAKGSADASVLSYLQTSLSATRNEVVQHGGCLGLGLAGMGAGTSEQYSLVNDTLNSLDSAVAGEAAGICIGLLLLGRLNEPIAETAITECLAYAHETKHEKVIRGISLGMAFIAYAQEEAADSLIAQMVGDTDAIIRYGGMYAIGMAYVGTSSNAAVRKLLHVAVSDVNDDVRRAAVSNLGFVLLRSQEQVPKLVSLLAESYNPHVRYGACIAVGIACARTGNSEAVRLLEPMITDISDLVRQGAILALSMVLQQEAAARNPKAKEFRDKISAIVTEKHHSTMSKLGAILGQGIIDAGGRNMALSLRSRAGFVKSTAVVGMAMFLQHWFWYPYMHFISLALAPTAIIGLDRTLQEPKAFSVTCHAKPSDFAYPPKLEVKKEEKREKIQTVELSTTAKARARARKKGADAMEDDQTPATAPEAAAAEEKKAEEQPVAEPTSFTVSNPGRVTYNQQNYVRVDASQRFVPIRKDATKYIGVVLLRDNLPGDAVEYIRLKRPGEEDPEPEPPADFEWTPQ